MENYTEFMYFPLLLCKAKCGNKNVNDADRQNVRSARSPSMRSFSCAELPEKMALREGFRARRACLPQAGYSPSQDSRPSPLH
ncbi:hypothetical protein LTR91_026808, partial [Friedmanniomyces endolithicus]